MQTLLQLDLQHNNLGPGAGSPLADALRMSSTLQSPNLYFNDLQDVGGRAMAEGLRVNTTITTLDLSENSLEANAIQALAVALCNNTTLRILRLSDNEPGDGSVALARAMHVNSSLDRMKLSCCKVHAVAAEVFADALLQHGDQPVPQQRWRARRACAGKNDAAQHHVADG
jgi:Ran GTPase-activating protein (RanGAP) involved in mRNA processing and transport